MKKSPKQLARMETDDFSDNEWFLGEPLHGKQSEPEEKRLIFENSFFPFDYIPS
jgi:hypothetical protein